MKPIIKSYLVEINTGTTAPGNNSNILFQDFPQLRDVYIFGICSMDNNTLAKSPGGRTIVSATAQGGVTITILDTFNMEMIKNFPCKSLDPFYMSGYYRDFVPFKLQLTKSYITITDNTGFSGGESMCFNIFYLESKNFEKQIAAKSFKK